MHVMLIRHGSRRVGAEGEKKVKNKGKRTHEESVVTLVADLLQTLTRTPSVCDPEHISPNHTSASRAERVCVLVHPKPLASGCGRDPGFRWSGGVTKTKAGRVVRSVAGSGVEL
jgi:hypothetical protein